MKRGEYMIGFIGGGNMAEALIKGTLQSGMKDIMVSEPRDERRAYLEKTYGIKTTSDNKEICTNCTIIILAVKPQNMDDVTAEISGIISSDTLIVSIAAGITLSYLSTRLKTSKIIRVMPNTPALVLAGMSGMSANANATPEDLATTRTILGALGKVMAFKEADLDAVTALSGSGPAYVFYFIESMIAGGLAAGLEPEAAETLTLQTLKGALKLLRERKEPPEILRRKVTSPGGTTEAALKVMENHQVKQNIVAAIVAAARRSQELSR
jgi:pyrroline-5-carboxylate reductase